MIYLCALISTPLLSGAINVLERGLVVVPKRYDDQRCCEPNDLCRPVPCYNNIGYYWSSNCCPPRPTPADCRNSVNIITKISVNQSNNADSSGGDGGAGGSAAVSQAASAANGEGANSSASAASGIAQESEELAQAVPGTPDPALENLGILPDPVTVSAVIGTTSGGSGGGGGAGGENSSTQSNSSTITVENMNVIILACDHSTDPSVSLGVNNRKLDIRVDENGDTYLNGEKMDEKDLGNGTKVFIFRNSESQNTTDAKPISEPPAE